jgi:hypothetical protein
MKYGFHEDAEKELMVAIEYYEECQPNLGLRFSEEVYSTIKRICEIHMHGQRLMRKQGGVSQTSFRMEFSIAFLKVRSELWLLCICTGNRLAGKVDNFRVGGSER